MKRFLIGLIGCVLIALPHTTLRQVFAQESLIFPTQENDARTTATENSPKHLQDLVYFGDERSATLFDESEIKSDFWSLCRYFESEQMLTYCGVASSVATLNSPGVQSPDVPQIYPHKMFTQENFFTDAVLQIRPPADVEKEGSTLDQLTAMLSTFDVDVKQYRVDALTVGKTRKLLVDAMRSPDQRVIIDFDRNTLGQTGGGHFSPLAAWHEGEDRFLMMDVARYRLPPSWVKAVLLHKAMSIADPVSGTSRGFMVLTKEIGAAENSQE